MARIVIVTYGSLGDLHPAIALAHGLQARGHFVAIATSEPYREKIRALGIAFHAIRPDLSLSDDVMVRRVMNGRRGSEFLLRDLVYPGVRDMYADLSAIAAEADLLVTSELACAAPLLGERVGIRWAYFALSPISFLSSADPSVLPGPGMKHLRRLGAGANRALLNVARLASHSWWKPVRVLRGELGLPRGASPLFEGKFSPHLNLALFSSALQPPPSDWPPRTVQTGFLFHDEEPTAGGRHELARSVGEFLEAGEPPIVFTLGSAAVKLARTFYEESAEAARRLGRRAVLLLGGNPPPPNLPPSVFAWDYLPYARIFPHAAAIVHQGGVGTTAQAMRAGRPMLVIPFAHDQFDNAARVRRLGIGRVITRSSYGARAAARELRALFDEPAVARAAAKIGERIQAERGVDAACDALERILV